MEIISREELEKLRKEYPEGTRLRLTNMTDPQAPAAGTLGNVTNIDDIGTIHVAWDTGSSLGLVYGEDTFEIVAKVIDKQYDTERGLVYVARIYNKAEDARNDGYSYAFHSSKLNKDLYSKTLDDRGLIHEFVTAG